MDGGEAARHAFFRRSGKSIVLFTVQEILDEHLAKKLALGRTRRPLRAVMVNQKVSIPASGGQRTARPTIASAVGAAYL